ncbi:MAG: MBL fold metallo-hydrolase [Cyclobacteriaceae bacterium]|nr:MBL fold metallo-hydrolase [Cyclobacteriaceae bacterium]
MKVNLWGVRGSIPTTGSETKVYGGQTSCMVVSEEDSLIVLDGGSGIQTFNDAHIPKNKRVDILLTHLHMDHIQGLGFFKPFFREDVEIHLWGPSSNTDSLSSRLSRYFSPPLFPVRLLELPCKLVMHEIGNTDFNIGNFKIQSSYIIHPGPTLGYRIEGKQSVFTYLPDHEPALGRNGMIKDHNWISGYNIAHHADLLYHDGQYTATNYATHKGWGHSSIEDTLAFAAACEIKHLLIGHHDPSRTDAQLDELTRELREDVDKYNFEFNFAIEGSELEL